MTLVASHPQFSTPTLPAIVTTAGEGAAIRFLEFFAGTIRNPHRRRAYGRAAGSFLAWCESRGMTSILAVQPLHVAAWIELQTRDGSASSVQQQQAPIRNFTHVRPAAARYLIWRGGR